MGNEAMSDKITFEGVGPRFAAMTPAQRQLFLATYAHEITILARGHFAEKDLESARLCNETLHRVVGHLGTLLRNPTAAVESSFAEMLVAGAIQKGWGEILLRSMQMSG